MLQLMHNFSLMDTMEDRLMMAGWESVYGRGCVEAVNESVLLSGGTAGRHRFDGLVEVGFVHQLIDENWMNLMTEFIHSRKAEIGDTARSRGTPAAQEDVGECCMNFSGWGGWYEGGRGGYRGGGCHRACHYSSRCVSFAVTPPRVLRFEPLQAYLCTPQGMGDA